MAEEKGAPAWMISFGDMMTLILTFFILLVSMSAVQQVGLIASGVGSFLLAVRSFGLPGVMDDNEQASTFENVRNRFSLPPEDDPEMRAEHIEATNLELIRASVAKSLEPHDQIGQPAVAVFEPGSAALSESSRRYLDMLSTTLFPSGNQSLVLEGHAGTDETSTRGERALLAFRRARVVSEYLVEEHEYPPLKVHTRAWLAEIDPPGPAVRSVDARVVVPAD